MTTILRRWHTPADIQTWTTEPWTTTPSSCSNSCVLLCSPVAELAHPCIEIIPSWSAATPPGTWIELRLRVRVNDTMWTTDYHLARWDSLTPSRRTSFSEQRDTYGRVATDTLCLDVPANAVQASVLLCTTGAALPQLCSLTLACSSPDSVGNDAARSGITRELSVPQYSQYAYADGDGWCSPTSLAMVLGYWHQRMPEQNLNVFRDAAAVPALAPSVYDPTYEGHGNWSFNVAYAAALGLEAFVTRLDTLEQVEHWINAEVPVIASISWKQGQLAHAPIARSAGHLLVITGFTEAGDVIVADPAGADVESVRRVYKRDQFAACWLRACGGTVYLIYPSAWGTSKQSAGSARQGAECLP